MSEFLRIKKAVDDQRNKKMQGEARVEALESEAARIYKEVSTQTGKEVSTPTEVQNLADSMKGEIESDITKMKEILDKEGVAY